VENSNSTQEIPSKNNPPASQERKILSTPFSNPNPKPHKLNDLIHLHTSILISYYILISISQEFKTYITYDYHHQYHN
jgi:hypothetical protein